MYRTRPNYWHLTFKLILFFLKLKEPSFNTVVKKHLLNLTNGKNINLYKTIKLVLNYRNPLKFLKIKIKILRGFSNPYTIGKVNQPVVNEIFTQFKTQKQPIFLIKPKIKFFIQYRKKAIKYLLYVKKLYKKSLKKRPNHRYSITRVKSQQIRFNWFCIRSYNWLIVNYVK